MISFFRLDLENMPDMFWMRWLVFLSLVMLITAWHFYHNIKILANKPANESAYAQSLRTVAWHRSAYIVMLSFLCLMFGFIADARRVEKLHTEEALAGAQQLNDALSSPTSGDATIQAALAAYAEDKVDEVKARYEDNFVSYMYLRACNRVQENDYQTILQALQVELKNLNVTKDLSGSVYSAAQGSYEILYTSVNCDDATINPVLQGYNAALQVMRDMIAQDATRSSAVQAAQQGAAAQ